MYIIIIHVYKSVHSEESEFTRSSKNYQEIIFLYCFHMHECNFVVRLGRLINFLSNISTCS
jgi:hypothetical protein